MKGKDKNQKIHKPVLLKEAIEYLNIKKGGKYIDATVGLGGHAEKILQKGGEVLGIDWDKEVLEIAKEHLRHACPDAPWQIIQGNFSNIQRMAKNLNFLPADGVLFDLGLSYYHYKLAGRGFSFDEDEFLDLRIGGKGLTGYQIVNFASKKELSDLFSKTVQEKLAGQIAEAIVERRKIKKIKTSKELSEIVVRVYEEVFGKRKHRLHPATKVFLSLRIAVNKEFENLKKGLEGALRILSPTGRLVVISFHSGEDRIVKQFFKQKSTRGELRILTKKAIRPTQKELRENPAARSALLRAAEKL